MTILRNYEHVAQKEHWCDRCCMEIYPGQIYHGQVVVNDGRLVVFKTHVYPGCDEPEEPECHAKSREEKLERIVKKRAKDIAA